MKWSFNEHCNNAENLFSSQYEYLATIYKSFDYYPTLRLIPEYKWTNLLPTDFIVERFSEELGIDSNTPVDEVKSKIETLYRLHGYE